MFQRLAFTVLFALTLAGTVNAEEGRFIKGSGAAVYAATRTQKHLIVNPTCYVAAGGRADFSDVKVVSNAELAALPDAAPVLCERAYVKFSNDPTVYMVQGGLLRPFPDPTCAFKNGVATNWSNIVALDPRWSGSYGYGVNMCPKP